MLGFTKVASYDYPFPWIQVSDGALLIMSKYDNHSYSALTYNAKELDRVVEDLEREGLVFTEKPGPNDWIKRYLLKSSDGYKVSLITYVEEFKQPEWPAMLTTHEKDFFNPEKYINKISGMFGKYAQSVANMEISIAW